MNEVDKDQLIVLKNFSYLTLMKFFNIGFKIFLAAYLIRVLGENTYGVITWSDSIIQYFIMLINFGFNVYAAKYIVEKRSQKDKMNEIISSILTIKAILFVTSFIILYFLFQISSTLANYKIILSLMLCMGIGEVFFPIWYFQGIEKLKIATVIVFFSRLLLIILTLLFVKGSEDILLYIFFILVSNLTMGFSGLFILLKLFDFSFIWVSTKVLFKFLNESFMFFIGRFLSLIFNSGTIFLIGYYFTMEQVAGFDLALKIVMVFVIPFEMLQQAAFPTISRTKDKKFLKKLIIISLSLGILFFVIIYFNSELLLKTFGGEEMIKYLSLLQVLAILTPFVALTFILGTCALVAFGFFKEYNYSLIISSVIYFILLILLKTTDNLNFWNLVYLRVIADIIMVLIRLFYVNNRKILKVELI